MAAKLIDLSFTLNGRKVKVQIAPDTMLFALLREQGCASVRCACETTNCGLCTVWLDGDPVLSCSVPAARVEGRSVTTLEGLKAESEALARAMAADNSAQLSRVKRNLVRALREDVTPRQREGLLLYYAEQLNTRQIGEKLGVDKSTVARTIKRGEARLRRCLRYGAEAFLNAAAEGPP